MIPQRVNADYEFVLFHQRPAPPAINYTIEFFLFFLNQAPLYSQKKYSPQYLDHVKEITGRTPVVVASGPYENFWGPLQDLEAEKWWNSKLTSTELIKKMNWCSETRILTRESDLTTIDWTKDYILKDPYGMSGQKFIQLVAEESLDQKLLLLRRHLEHGPQILEPKFERLYDFSQYIFPNGKVIAYQNQVDSKFQYKGTVFRNRHSASLEDLSFYNEVSRVRWGGFREQIKIIQSFYAQRPNHTGYSIDSFIYREAGELKIRVMSEVNCRRTMGRVAFELGEIVKKGPWSAMLLIKTLPTTIPLWELLRPLDQVLVLSPGDSRFDILFLNAHDESEAREMIKKLKTLLPDAEFSIKI